MLETRFNSFWKWQFVAKVLQRRSSSPASKAVKSNKHYIFIMPSYKRQQHVPSAEMGASFGHSGVQTTDPTIAKLQTIGMRIRQSVSNGYKLPEYSGSAPAYMNDYEQQQMLNSNRRVPLPNHLQRDGPPALDYNGSTASSLSFWEEEINRLRFATNMQTLDEWSEGFNGMKRPAAFMEKEDREMQVSDYQARYGPLSFNEDF